MTTLSQQFIQKAILNTLQNQKCSDLHPGMSCNLKMFHQFFATCKSVYKMYLLVHIIPFLIFKRKQLRKKPMRQINNLIKGFIKSMLFAGGYTLIVRRTICFLTQHYKYNYINGVVGALLAGMSLNFQPTSRQSEIALFCVNKTSQTLYHMANRRNYPVKIPYGECLLLGVAVGVICYSYIDCPEAIRDNYKKVLQRLFGDL